MCKRNKALGVITITVVAMIISFMVFCEAVAQDNYELTINQRRMGDQIGAEIWLKSLTTNNPKLGNMSIPLSYNSNFLKPADLTSAYGYNTGNPAAITDSIYYDVNVEMPYVTINSPYNNNNFGFDNISAVPIEFLDAHAQTVKLFQLDVKYQTNGLGYTPQLEGKGTLVGVLKFDIINSDILPDAELTELQFYNLEDRLNLFDINNNVIIDIDLTLADDFTIRGITVLSPNTEDAAVKRYCNPSLESIGDNPGYPIYFERSGLLSELETYGPYGTATLAYSFGLSLDDGVTWVEMGRFAETYMNSSTMGRDEEYYISGEIAKLSDVEEYYITQANGVPLPDPATRPEDGFSGVLRFVWEADENYSYRSEEARLKLSQLNFDDNTTLFSEADIDDRSMIVSNVRTDTTDEAFSLSNYFFAQLNGENQYFRTKDNFSTPTVISVEAWVNLNELTDEYSEPAILASGSPNAQNEGPWMLYLKNIDDLVYPAFRALQLDESKTEHVADITSPLPLPIANAAGVVDFNHGDNWTHLAATVERGTVKLYMNGEVVAQSINSSNTSISMYPMQHPVYIGVNPNDNGLDDAKNYANAGIKEVKVWRIALSQEQLRKYIPGVHEPSEIESNQADNRIFLQLYYPLQANYNDFATEGVDQWGEEGLDFYSSDLTPRNDAINYRPDRPHIKLTSPVGGEGICNLEGENYEVRWASYGLGSLEDNTADLQIMVSRDGGSSWFDAIGEEEYPAKMLDRVEIEDGSVLWSPFNNASRSSADTDLQALVDIDSNYVKTCLLKISGTETAGADNIYSTSDTFTISPHYAFSNSDESYIRIEGSKDLALTGSTNMIEAWICPYKFPDEGEEYPIFSKKDGVNLHYSLSLTHTGQIKLSIYDTDSRANINIESSEASHILEPLTEANDFPWTHIAVWVNLADGGTSPTVRFYIDGICEIISLDQKIIIDRNCEYPNFIGFEPFNSDNTDGRFFYGELKEVRFWNGNPGGVELSGIEPSDLTLFIQGAQGVRANEFVIFGGMDYSENLVAAWSCDGGSWINHGIQNSIAVNPYDDNEHLVGMILGEGFSYQPTKPMLKIVEPQYQQSVSNQDQNLRVRWVGWDYDRNDALAPFRNGSDGSNLADLDFSTEGGGGSNSQAYQSVACQTQNASYQNAMMLSDLEERFIFLGTESRSQYAINLDMSITDPDVNNDYIYSDQGPINASQNFGRFRLIGRASMNGSELSFDNNGMGKIPDLLTESKLFNITPPSNFTVRVLLEGYHTGTDATIGGIQSILGNSYNDKGLRIKLYENIANSSGDLVASNESLSGYSNAAARNIINRNAGENNFANVPFVFTDVPDNNRYFVTVEHLNHLPVTSAYAAPFIYSGDDSDTWRIESGWDFSAWNGVSGNDLTQEEASKPAPEMEDKYGAAGPSENDPNEGEYYSKQLIYNSGRMGDTDNNAIASMIAGDVYRDGTINAYDRNLVNESVGGISSNADVTGDGFVNSADRTIVYRNNGFTFSPSDHPQNAVEYDDPGSIAMPLEMADYHIANQDNIASMLRAEQRYFENGGTTAKRREQASKATYQLLSSKDIHFEVYAQATRIDNYIDVEVFIKNIGDVWALGNSTFGLKYDPSQLQYTSYLCASTMPFSSSDEIANGYGYNKSFSNPQEKTKDPISGLRTIDIVYSQDAPSSISGVDVPPQLTSLGTLRFTISRSADYYFDWHIIKNVTDVNGLDITKFGDFKFIEPVMLEEATRITYPTAGAELTPNHSYRVTWSEPSYGNIDVELIFSSDNGDTWGKINSEDISIMAKAYDWVTPSIDSRDCFLLLREVESGTVIDSMKNSFAILAEPVHFLSPCTECGTLLSGETADITWDTDRPDNIYLEYSENGIDNWNKISETIACSDNIYKWLVPEGNTSAAVIRMKTIDGEVISLSTPFSILTGALTLLNPSGQVVKGATPIDITWEYTNVDKCDIEYSLDDGNSWTLIARSIDASESKYTWVAPDTNVTNALMRAHVSDMVELEYSRITFMIIEHEDNVVNPEKLGYFIHSVVPNPVINNTAEISFVLPIGEQVSANLYDVSGAKVMSIFENEYYKSGLNRFTINSENLETGSYILYLNMGKYTLSEKLLIIK